MVDQPSGCSRRHARLDRQCGGRTVAHRRSAHRLRRCGGRGPFRPRHTRRRGRCGRAADATSGTGVIDVDLVVAVVHDVARSLGEPGDLPVLLDPRLEDAEIASEVVAAASYHAVLPLLWHAMDRQTEVPAALRTTARDEFLTLVARALRLRHLVDVADSALTGAGVAYAIYKGPAVARHYPAAELRAFADVDLLLARSDLDRADAALRDAGLRGGWAGVPTDYGETTYSLGAQGTLDVHWHVMREPKVRAAFALDISGMLDRAERAPLGDGQVCVLDPVDELITVATHACFDGAYRLGWFVDVARLLTADEFSSAELRRRAARSHTGLPVQVILDRARLALGIEIPPPMARGAWRQTLRVLSVSRPVQRSFRQAGRGGLAYRATRRTSAHSFAAAGRLAITEGLRPLLSDPEHRWRMVRKRRL